MIPRPDQGRGLGDNKESIGFRPPSTQNARIESRSAAGSFVHVCYRALCREEPGGGQPGGLAKPELVVSSLTTANGANDANDAVGNNDALANDANTHQRVLQSSSRRHSILRRH
jgi:hypothetical protein